MNVTATHGLLGVSGIDDLGGRIPALGRQYPLTPANHGLQCPIHVFKT